MSCNPSKIFQMRWRFYNAFSRTSPVSPQVFFCKYNDPIYVKMEKLETIIRLVNDRNIDQVSTAKRVDCLGSGIAESLNARRE